MSAAHTTSLETTEATDLTAAGIPLWRSIAVLVLCLITAALCLQRNVFSSGTTAGVIMSLPRVLGGYVGEDMEVTQAEKTILPLDTEFERSVYTSLDGAEVNCQIVLSGGEKRSIHRPEICLPGQGWTIKSARPVRVRIGESSSLEVMELTLERPVEFQDGSRKMLENLFMYWFVGSDKTTAKHHERILLTSKDRVFENINHRWAYVVVSSPVLGSIYKGGRNRESTEAMLHEFIAEVTPYIHTQEVLDSLRY